MKKSLIGIFISAFLLTSNISNDNVLYFDDVNTLNFTEKVTIDTNKIIKLCSYDYCDYIRSEDIDNALDIFTKKYIDELSEEEKTNLWVKGIRITSIEIR